MKAHDLAQELLAGPNTEVYLPLEWPPSRFCGDPTDFAPVESVSIETRTHTNSILLWPSEYEWDHTNFLEEDDEPA